MSTPKKRTLQPLEPQLGPTGAREWLAHALKAPAGYTVTNVYRAGREKTDPATITLEAGDDQPRLRIRFAEQRQASVPGPLRDTVASQTNGKARPAYLTVAEASDVYLAICIAGDATSAQDALDEAREWLDQILAAAHVETKFTLTKTGRYDALDMLRRRGVFDRRRANSFLAGTLDPLLAPVLLVDSKTGERYLRAAEAATYIRHVIGTPPVSQPALDARLAEIGAVRLRYEERHGDQHPTCVFYRLPDDG